MKSTVRIPEASFPYLVHALVNYIVGLGANCYSNFLKVAPKFQYRGIEALFFVGLPSRWSSSALALLLANFTGLETLGRRWNLESLLLFGLLFFSFFLGDGSFKKSSLLRERQLIQVGLSDV